MLKASHGIFFPDKFLKALPIGRSWRSCILVESTLLNLASPTGRSWKGVNVRLVGMVRNSGSPCL